MTEARAPSGDLYGEKRLIECVSAPHASAAALLDAIEAGVLVHAGGREQADDITLLAVRRVI